ASLAFGRLPRRCNRDIARHSLHSQARQEPDFDKAAKFAGRLVCCEYPTTLSVLLLPPAHANLTRLTTQAASLAGPLFAGSGWIVKAAFCIWKTEGSSQIWNSHFSLCQLMERQGSA